MAKLLGVTPHTIRIYANDGKIKTTRTEGNQRIINKCQLYGIELEIADRFYPSSKMCSCCGNVRKQLSLSERVYKCKECGLEIDRDYNASINLSRYNKEWKKIVYTH